ncbi:MAG: hypothetical protein DRO39_07285 [Thermoprotei archaeon]|nr:MAG: hypothetical protein DRO39_07285 [Thermoprotei archaeon]
MSAPPKLGIAAVCLKELEPFFRALGVSECYAVDDVGKGIAILRRVVTGNYAVVFVQLAILRRLSELGIAAVNRMYPLVVAVPGPRELEGFDPKSFYREVVRRYVGFEVYV